MQYIAIPHCLDKPDIFLDFALLFQLPFDQTLFGVGQTRHLFASSGEREAAATTTTTTPPAAATATAKQHQTNQLYPTNVVGPQP